MLHQKSLADLRKYYCTWANLNGVIVSEIRPLHREFFEGESLYQCKTCGAHWFHRFLEIMKFDGPDDQTVWYSPVTEVETRCILDAETQPDLRFLLTRPSFRVDDQSVLRVPGQPNEPCYG